jgi:hypothetical protein
MFATVLRPVLYAISFAEVLTLIASVIGLVIWLSVMVWRRLTLITRTEPAEGPQTNSHFAGTFDTVKIQ